MCGCVYVWVFNVLAYIYIWLSVCVGIVKCGCVHVWVL